MSPFKEKSFNTRFASGRFFDSKASPSLEDVVGKVYASVEQARVKVERLASIVSQPAVKKALDLLETTSTQLLEIQKRKLEPVEQETTVEDKPSSFSPK